MRVRTAIIAFAAALTVLAGAKAYAQLKERLVNLRAFDASKLVVVMPKATVVPIAVRRKAKIAVPPARISAAEFASLKPQLAKAFSLKENQIPTPSSQNTITIAFGSSPPPPGTYIAAQFVSTEGSCTDDDAHPYCVMFQGNTSNPANSMNVVLRNEPAGTYLLTCYVETSSANIPYQIDIAGMGGINSNAAVQDQTVMIPLRLQANADVALTFPFDSSYPVAGELALYSCDVMKIL